MRHWPGTVLCALLFASTLLEAGVVPDEALNTVVALGKQMPDGTYEWVGSGFLYAYLHDPSKQDEFRYRPVIVTNRHVIEGMKEAVVRFNPGVYSKGVAEVLPLSLADEQGKPRWTAHPDAVIDLAVIAFDPSRFIPRRITHLNMVMGEREPNPEKVGAGVITPRGLAEIKAREGTTAYVLGFPIGVAVDGLFGADRNYPIVRRGLIAWAGPYLKGQMREFLLDAFIFPGNSGSPVLAESESGKMHLVGMVKGYVPYSDKAVSRQTGRVRVTFEENSGLAIVIPAEAIEQAITAMKAAATAK